MTIRLRIDSAAGARSTDHRQARTTPSNKALNVSSSQRCFAALWTTLALLLVACGGGSSHTLATAGSPGATGSGPVSVLYAGSLVNVMEHPPADHGPDDPRVASGLAAAKLAEVLECVE